MNLIERLYIPDAKDIASGLFQRRWAESLAPNGVAAAQVGANSAVCPGDTMRIIDQLSATLLPGAAQTPLGVLIRLYDSTSSTLVASVAFTVPSGGAALRAFGGIGGLSLIMLPGEFLAWTAYFDAGAAVNTPEFYVSGVECPRGNTQR